MAKSSSDFLVFFVVVILVKKKNPHISAITTTFIAAVKCITMTVFGFVKEV